MINWDFVIYVLRNVLWALAALAYVWLMTFGLARVSREMSDKVYLPWEEEERKQKRREAKAARRAKMKGR